MARLVKLCAFAGALVMAAVAGVDAQVQQLKINPNITNGWAKEVNELPGWNGKLPARFFSGMAQVTKGTDPKVNKTFMHYQIWGTEADVTEAPVIVWWNGGPGAPSSFGMFAENGPLLLNQQSLMTPEFKATSMPSLIYNPHAWTRKAIMVSVDPPPPTGFSYCEPPGQTGGNDACGPWNDVTVGNVTADALRVIFDEHFPGLLRNKAPLYFMGESYAGVYISETVKNMAQLPQYGTFRENLRGVALGDACMGYDQICGIGEQFPLQWHWLEWTFGRGQYSIELHDELHSKCTKEELRWQTIDGYSKQCRAIFDKVSLAVNNASYGGYYLYSLCPSDINPALGIFSSSAASSSSATAGARVFTTTDVTVVAAAAAVITALAFTVGPAAAIVAAGIAIAGWNSGCALSSGAGTFFPPTTQHVFDVNGYQARYQGDWCGQTTVYGWYFSNFTSVRRAFGVADDAQFSFGDNAVGMEYTNNAADEFAFWKTVIGKTTPYAFSHDVRLYAYEGDSDPAVDQVLVETKWYEFARNNSYKKTSEWHGWATSDTSVVGAGYNVQWMDNRISFTTIRGSGHEVPQYRPEAAYTFMASVVDDSPLPPICNSQKQSTCNN